MKYAPGMLIKLSKEVILLDQRGLIKNLIIQTGKEIHLSGLVVGTWGNVSARIPGEENLISITPSGMDYLSLTTEDLVLSNLAGKIVEGIRKPSIELPLHLAVYKARPEMKAIVHVHSVYATAWAAARRAIPGALEDLVQIVGGDVRVADYALPGTEALGLNAIKALEDRQGVLLANHGLLGIGQNLKEALKVCQIVEKAAKTLLASQLLGGAVALSKEDILNMRDFYLNSYGQR